MINKKIHNYLLFLLPLLKISALIGQTDIIKGRVIDENTQKPIPFVNIVYNDKNQGLTSDMDGRFSLEHNSDIRFLKFSYVGYQTVLLNQTDFINNPFLVVRMSEKTFDINEITVFPAENPAHRIIKLVVANSEKNNPEKLESYSYKAYNKMYYTFTFDPKKTLKRDSVPIDSVKVDTVSVKIAEILKTQHLFLMESVSERMYKRPGKINEKVIASRVSGLSEPSFVMLATQLQSLSFYGEMITLLESRYINPISHGSTNRYFFNIEDTTFTERGDTVFTISFRPKKGRIFEGLKGVLNINSYKYAIQSVVAEPVDDEGLLSIKIQQNYQLIDDKNWFPKELNTDIIFTNMPNPRMEKYEILVMGVGKSYIDDVVLNKELKNNTFSAIEVDVDNSAFNQSDSAWQKFRKDSLSLKEKKTYKVVDSIGQKLHFDRKLKVYKTVATGYIPIRFIDFNPFALLDFNEFEGYRPRLAIRTNDKISDYFSLMGYGAYGFKDKQWKYGGGLCFNIAPRQEFKISFNYSNDVVESSGYQHYVKNEGFSSGNLRNFIITDKTYQEKYETNIEFRTLKWWKVNLFVNQKTMINRTNYYFTNSAVTDEPYTKYRFQETGLQLKFAPNESKAFVAGELFSINDNTSSALYLNLIKGIKNQYGDFDYTKIEAWLNLSFLTKVFGRTNFQIVGGKLLGNLPYFMMYNGHGNYYNFAFDAPNSFATMRMNEFLSDEFFTVHLRQDVGSFIFKTEKFKPELLLTTSIGYGSLGKPQLHNRIEYKTMENGYFESGIQINQLLMYLKMIGFGFGVYYRYGPYSFSNNSDNFAYKLALTFKL